MLTHLWHLLTGRRARPRLPRSASVYRRDERVVLHAVGVSREGASHLREPVITLELGRSPQLGAGLREVLAEWLGDEELPAGHARSEQLLFQGLGVTSWPHLHDEAAHVSAWQDGDDIVLEPHRSGGSRGDQKGFEPLERRDVRVNKDADDVELGRALAEALARCETRSPS